MTDQTSNTTGADDDEAFEGEAMRDYESDYGSDVDDKEKTKTQKKEVKDAKELAKEKNRKAFLDIQKSILTTQQRLNKDWKSLVTKHGGSWKAHFNKEVSHAARRMISKETIQTKLYLLRQHLQVFLKRLVGVQWLSPVHGLER